MRFGIKLSNDAEQSDKEFRLTALCVLTIFFGIASSHLKHDKADGWVIEIGGATNPTAIAVYGAGCAALGLGYGVKEATKKPDA